MKKKKGLNTRQWDLYNYLKENYAEGIYISKYEICQALPYHYNFNVNETRMCRLLENDVRIINNSDIIQKIIVSNKHGYKIGNDAEITEYLNRRFRRDLKSLKLNWQLANKVALDGQMRLTFGNERDVIEAIPH